MKQVIRSKSHIQEPVARQCFSAVISTSQSLAAQKQIEVEGKLIAEGAKDRRAAVLAVFGSRVQFIEA